MLVREVMTTQLYSMDKQESVARAAQVMKEANVGAIPVHDGEKVVGMITDRDVTIRNVALAHDPALPLEEVMTADLISVSPDTGVQEAAEVMAKHQVRRLPVTENGELVGMVALGDLATEKMSNEKAGEALSQISTPSKPKLN